MRAQLWAAHFYSRLPEGLEGSSVNQEVVQMCLLLIIYEILAHSTSEL